MARLVLIFSIFLITAVPAFGADDVLRLRSGKLAVGEIVSTDEKGVTLRTGSGDAKYDWETLTPFCEYEIRAERADPEDAKGHAILAQFCLRHGLYADARHELDVARSVGHPDGARLDALLAAVDQAEAEAAFARIEQLMVQEEYDLALEEVRRFIVQAPLSEHTRRAREMVPDLLRRMDSQKLRQEEEKKQEAEDRKAARLAKRINKYQAEADAARDKAASSWIEALRYHEKGNVTRARKGYEATGLLLIKAMKALARLQRYAGRGVASEKADRELEVIRKRLVEVYLGLAQLFIDDKNYKRGGEYVNRVLFLDPVNKEALDLRTKVDENRIRLSLRKLTNTPVRYR